jgi:hypothetical protein
LSILGRIPQLPFVQTAGGTHSPPPVVHVDAQAAAEPAVTHLKGAHSKSLGVTHAPCPSHADMATNVVP